MNMQIVSLLGGLMLVLGSTSAFAAGSELILGVQPFKPPTLLIKAFTPLANYLSERIGRSVVVKVSKDYQTHIDLIGTDQVDIAYIGPAPYVMMREKYGEKRLLARQAIAGSPTFHGNVFVRADSDIHTLKELRGKRIALGDPNSTMSYLLPRYLLLQAGIDEKDSAGFGVFGDHTNIVLAVLAGEYAAGAVKEDVFIANQQRGLRAIATTPPISDHLFVAGKALDDKTVEVLRTSMFVLAGHPGGAEILNAMTKGVTELSPVVDEDYANMRSILQQLKAHGVVP
jgi:phosphonate transport system substrate-binding protein